MAEVAFQITVYNYGRMQRWFECLRRYRLLHAAAIFSTSVRNDDDQKENLQLLNLQLKTDNCQLKTFYANPLILKKNCSTFAVRFMGYLQGCRGSGKFFNKKT
jgi:hypothetical protein